MCYQVRAVLKAEHMTLGVKVQIFWYTGIFETIESVSPYQHKKVGAGCRERPCRATTLENFAAFAYMCLQFSNAAFALQRFFLTYYTVLPQDEQYILQKSLSSNIMKSNPDLEECDVFVKHLLWVSNRLSVKGQASQGELLFIWNEPLGKHVTQQTGPGQLLKWTSSGKKSVGEEKKAAFRGNENSGLLQHCFILSLPFCHI